MFRNEFPIIARALRLPSSNPEVANFFLDFAKQAIDYRKKNVVSKKDFLQQLTEIKRIGLSKYVISYILKTNNIKLLY